MTENPRKVALVTGGARGIGRAIVDALAPDHRMALTWSSTDPSPVLTDHPDALVLQTDLTHDTSAERAIRTVIAHFGRLDVIVNNAGLVAMTPPDAFDPEAHAAIYRLNVSAPAALLAAALPHLQPGAAVVSISSVNAVLPPRGAAAYGASKAALNLWTRAMARDLGPRGIRVNAVAPGATNIPEAPRDPDLTALFVQDTALGRVATPGDIARAVRFLASDDAGFITGEVLTVSGGYRL